MMNTHDHNHADHGHAGHAHTHGIVDPTLVTTERGIWAVKWSLVGLAITALLQVGVVLVSGSVALLADTIHNIGDAMTAIPLWARYGSPSSWPGASPRRALATATAASRTWPAPSSS